MKCKKFLQIRKQSLFSINHFVYSFDIESHVFHILTPLNPSIRIDAFADGAGTAGYDRLLLLHNQDIVTPALRGAA